MQREHSILDRPVSALSKIFEKNGCLATVGRQSTLCTSSLPARAVPMYPWGQGTYAWGAGCKRGCWVVQLLGSGRPWALVVQLLGSGRPLPSAAGSLALVVRAFCRTTKTMRPLNLGSCCLPIPKSSVSTGVSK